MNTYLSPSFQNNCYQRLFQRIAKYSDLPKVFQPEWTAFLNKLYLWVYEQYAPQLRNYPIEKSLQFLAEMFLKEAEEGIVVDWRSRRKEELTNQQSLLIDTTPRVSIEDAMNDLIRAREQVGLPKKDTEIEKLLQPISETTTEQPSARSQEEPMILHKERKILTFSGTDDIAIPESAHSIKSLDFKKVPVFRQGYSLSVKCANKDVIVHFDNRDFTPTELIDFINDQLKSVPVQLKLDEETNCVVWESAKSFDLSFEQPIVANLLGMGDTEGYTKQRKIIGLTPLPDCLESPIIYIQLSKGDNEYEFPVCIVSYENNKYIHIDLDYTIPKGDQPCEMRIVNKRGFNYLNESSLYITTDFLR